MRSSLFWRVTRYRASAALNPRENRLTEVTAAALEHVDGLAAGFVRDLVCQDAGRLAGPEGDIDAALRADMAFEVQYVGVATQVGTRSGGWVDLEVVLRPSPSDGRPGLLVWVEVKHGARVHGDQLDTYRTDIWARFPGEDFQRVVVLLAPRGSVPVQPPHADVLRAVWQGTARAVVKFAPSVTAPEQRWLLDEYIRYLEEEGLSDPRALSVSTALSLMERWNAEDAVAGICEHADAYVQKHWGPRTDHEKLRTADRGPAYGLNYWATYETFRDGEPPKDGWDNLWFEWGLRDASSLQYMGEAPRGAFVFMAGSSAYAADDPLKREGNEDWAGRLAAHEFHHVWLDDYRNVRLRYPDELLAHTTLEQQGITLGKWIVDAFEALAGDPPDA